MFSHSELIQGVVLKVIFSGTTENLQEFYTVAGQFQIDSGRITA